VFNRSPTGDKKVVGVFVRFRAPLNQPRTGILLLLLLPV
jgi:hypothetical protein